MSRSSPTPPSTERREALFITGASGGIGAQLVRDSAAAGFDVGFTYYKDAANAERVLYDAREIAPDGRFEAWHVDQRAPDEVETVVDAAIDTFDEIAAVVLNAGITRTGLMFSMSDEDWRDVIDTNLTGPFFVCRQFLPHFIGNRHGRFIHISSVAMYGMAGQVGYCASKGGVQALSNAIAKEYGRKGVTSNTLALGLFDGGMSETDASDRSFAFWKQFCPAGRLGELSEIAAAVHFLVSPNAAFINGDTLHLAGGLSRTP